MCIPYSEAMRSKESRKKGILLLQRVKLEIKVSIIGEEIRLISNILIPRWNKFIILFQHF